MPQPLIVIVLANEKIQSNQILRGMITKEIPLSLTCFRNLEVRVNWSDEPYEDPHYQLRLIVVTTREQWQQYGPKFNESVVGNLYRALMRVDTPGFFERYRNESGTIAIL